VPRIDFVIPVYKERPEVLRQTVAGLRRVIAEVPGLEAQILVVNDGSPPEYDYGDLAAQPGVTLLRQPENRGYSAAIKQGIRHSAADWIAITDADGTYPTADFPRLIARLDGNDMVVGARVTGVRNIPWLRRFPKFVLTRFASYVAGHPILDLNSGMRIFSRARALEFWAYYPDGFSFTSTITLAFMASGYSIEYVPIDYYKRQGKSSIRPLQDTRLFFYLVGKMGLLFAPLRVFGPLAAVMFLLALGKGARDYLLEGHIGNFAVSAGIAALQIFLMGLLAEIIVKKR
jgi:glycosyltransferase involved in cell wall biosynthesis